jgi:subtilisin-like proprotein convertase family protein
MASASLQKGSVQMSDEAARQIQALIAEKESRTPAQQKMDSQLIYAQKINRRQAIANGVETLETRVEVDSENMTIVDMTTNNLKVTYKQLEAMKVEVLSALNNSIRARVRLDDLDTIAGFPEVIFVMPRQDAKLSGRPNPNPGFILPRYTTRMPGARSNFAERAARVREQLLASLPQKGVSPNATTVVNVSEGDKTHKADAGRAAFGANGSGVKIGVLSDGVSNLAAAQATGDLGPVTVLPGQTGSGDEGTAMLEIVHDLAPGAQLYFATAFTSLVSFAQNIRDLRTAGCDIIIDDVIYFVETPMQDGQAPTVVSPTNGGAVLQAVNDVTAAGAMYFSSAGNEGSVTKASASVWEGDFVDGGANALIPGGTVHNFGAGNLNDQITSAGARALLFWSDPLGGSNNDYDLFVLNSTATAVAASSTNIQNGTQDPQEDAGNRTTGQRLVIFKKTGAVARFLHLNCFGATMALTTSGNTHGHSQGALAYSVAATPADDPFCSGDPQGPYPNPFTTANKIECFSSDGPRRILYNANSTPITMGNVSSTGGVLRQKPDITAADGVAVTGVGGFPNPFYGTSAASPHAGAIAALVKSAVPGITNAQVRTALTSSAKDIEGAGVDRDSGAGIIMAFEAMQAAGATPMAVIVSAGATIVSESCTPANGALDPGETVTVSFCVQNTGAVNTTALMGTLQATGGVTSPSGPQNYGVVVAGGPPVCRNFTFTVSGTCGGTVTATIHFQDGATDLGNVTYSFLLGAAGAPVTKSFTFAPGITIPDSNAAGVNIPVVVSGVGNIADVNFRIDGTSCNTTNPSLTVGVDHSWVGDLAFTLTSPGGTSVVLMSRPGGGTFGSSGNNFCQTVLDDEGGNPSIQSIQSTGAPPLGPPYTGTFTPLNALSAFDGQNANGTWTLNVSDNAAGDTGFVRAFSLIFSPLSCATGCAVPCTITCPANITKSNDPNQCGAVVTYPAPTTTGTCGTVTCSPASGSFFPVGTTTVTCSTTAGPSCTFTVTVNDTQPPVITCPANITAATANVNDPCTVVNYTTTASDNCPGVTVVCTPPSGSCFPVGTTTVTCTATDASGNTATCSFTVSVFNGRLEDDSEGCNNTVLFNTLTGDYRWCCHGTIFTGRGKVLKSGNTYQLTHNPADRRVQINLNAGASTPNGNGSLQFPPGTTRCVIADRDIRNDTCLCGAAGPPAAPSK